RRQSALFTWGSEYQVPEGAGNFADETAAADSAVASSLDFYLPRYTDGFGQLAPVASFPAHRSGLYDLAGNVSEWTHDYYTVAPPDTRRIALDPAGEHADAGEGHVVKGSSWRDGRVETLRAAYRQGAVDGEDDLGLRVGRYIY
ncbi:MAG: SUMF1/EgtB/PvdO family nonheme iron enzyme, partial [Pseudomonadota bacterium]